MSESKQWYVEPMKIHGWAIHDAEGNVVVANIYEEEIARFIVRAANNYEPLVKALREAKDLIKIWHGAEAWDVYDFHSPEMIRINRVLALAEKES